MMFELVILFTGLCAYVPEFPITPQNNGFNQMRVLMPTIPGHDAVLLVKQSNVVSFPGSCTLAEKKEHAGVLPYYRCNLTRRLVTVAPARQNRLAFVTTRVDRTACPNATDARDFSWVVPMDTVHAKDVSASISCLFTPEMEPLRLKTQVLLTEGVVEAGSFSRLGADNGEIAIWEFGEGGPRQALADIVRVERTIPGDRIRFDIMDLGSQSWEELVLRPDAGQVVVEIKNVPTADICRDSAGTGTSVGYEDQHFRYLDKLLEGLGHTSRKMKIVTYCHLDDPPEPEGFCLDTDLGPPLVGNPQCPGASMDPP